MERTNRENELAAEEEALSWVLEACGVIATFAREIREDKIDVESIANLDDVLRQKLPPNPHWLLGWLFGLCTKHVSSEKLLRAKNEGANLREYVIMQLEETISTFESLLDAADAQNTTILSILDAHNQCMEDCKVLILNIEQLRPLLSRGYLQNILQQESNIACKLACVDTLRQMFYSLEWLKLKLDADVDLSIVDIGSPPILDLNGFINVSKPMMDTFMHHLYEIDENHIEELIFHQKNVPDRVSNVLRALYMEVLMMLVVKLDSGPVMQESGI